MLLLLCQCRKTDGCVLQKPRGSPVVFVSLNVFGHKEVGLTRSHQVPPAQAATLWPCPLTLVASVSTPITVSST